MKERLLPLGIKNPVKTELPALIALEAIGQPWYNEGHLADLCALGLLAQTIAPEGSDIVEMAVRLLDQLNEPTLDTDALRPLVIELSAWLQRQPNGRVDAAIRKLLVTVKSAR